MLKTRIFHSDKLGNCLWIFFFFFPRLLLFAKKSEENFFSDVKKMFPTSVPLCFSILYFVWVLPKQDLKSGKRQHNICQLGWPNDTGNQLNLLVGCLKSFFKAESLSQVGSWYPEQNDGVKNNLWGRVIQMQCFTAGLRETPNVT